jgi:hypothetical protein
VTGDRDTLRQELAEALVAYNAMSYEHAVDALLPVVERATVRAQQQALRDAADAWESEGAADVARDLRTRVDALAGEQ